MSKKNYFKTMDQRLYDFFISLGDQDLGEFDPTGESYRGQHYALGEVPLLVVSQAIGYRLQSGLATKRLNQLVAVGAITWRKNGVGKPSFLSLKVSDHDRYFALALSSRIDAAREVNPNFSTITLPFVQALQRKYLDDGARFAALSDVLRRSGSSLSPEAAWRQVVALRGDSEASKELNDLLGV